MSNGIKPRLKEVILAVNEWCRNHGVRYDLACDESDIQGIKLFQKDRTLINNLLESIADILEQNHVHLETQKVRGGTILAFSLEALSESAIQAMLEKLGEEMEAMTFEDRVADALTKRPTIKPQPPKNVTEADLLASAVRIVEGPKPPAAPEPVKETIAPRPRGFGQRVAAVFGIEYQPSKSKFNRQLAETLGGIATPTGAQPVDLFEKFAQALRVLGDQMGVGPLQDRLKEQGINWKKSDDGQSIILYIVNGQTNATQPIARISSQTLENPGDFEEQLTNMLDFAKGDAPGAFKQKQEELQNQQKAVRDIARAVSPKDQQSPAAQAMNGGVATTPQIQTPQPQAAPTPAPVTQPAAAQPAAQPAKPQPAGQAAAQQAASPKPRL